MKPKHNRRFCLGCRRSKMWFETQAKAENFLKFNKENIAAKSSKVPSRSYYCSFCCGWHITSIENEEVARERDARDEQLWETIMSSEIVTKCGTDNDETITPPITFKKSLPKTNEGWQIQTILFEVDENCSKASNAMLSSDFSCAEELLDAARMAYDKANAKSAEFGIYSKKINKRGDRIEELSGSLLTLKSLVGSPEEREGYMIPKSDSTKDKAFAQMVYNLDKVEIIESLFSKASEALAGHDSDTVKSICKEIADIVNNELKYVSQNTRNSYINRMIEIQHQNRVQTEEEPLTESEKKTVIKVIDLLQEAYSALEDEDIDSAEQKIRQAIHFIPEKENETIDTLILEAERINELIQNAGKRKRNMLKILFLHGFTSSGSCSIAESLKANTKSIANVIAPDLPLHPYKAMDMLKDLCMTNEFDLIVGSSCGAFYGQQLVRFTGVPAILINPHFKMTEFLEPRIGMHNYKSIRKDGNNTFEITPQLIEEFRKMESEQFDAYDDFNRGRVWGMFGKEDTLAHFRGLFEEYYSTAIDFDGGHTISSKNVKKVLIPAIKRMMQEVKPVKERRFRHFKGNEYRLCQIAKDSETQERVVVYQAMYGSQGYWVRPEKMFFERIERDGKEFPRFSEIV